MQIINVSRRTLVYTNGATFLPFFQRCMLRRHAPLKQKYIRANNAPFMTKELRNSLMNRSKLKNKFSRVKTLAAHQEHKRHYVPIF